MIGFKYNRSIPTNLKLNGPILEWTTNPTDSFETLLGFATFVGVINASYPDGQGDVAQGSFQFHWYLDDVEIFDTAIDPTSNVSIVSDGNQTTCKFTTIDFTNNGKSVYVVADYIPVEGEANAINDNLKSNTATLFAFPEIVINSQPTDVIVGSGLDANFNIDAEILPDNGDDISYQWQMDGKDLVEGSQVLSETTESEIASIRVTSDKGDDFEIDFFQLSTFSNFLTGRTYTLVANADITTRVYANGGGGGSSISRNVRGGSGGSAQGIMTFFQGESYILRIGGSGGRGGNGGFSGGGSGGGGSGRGGGGGGFTGIFKESISQSNAIIIGAGGGGGADDPANGGAGGGSTGGNAGNFGRGGGGGTQSGGGSGGIRDGSPGTRGGALQGGSGGAGGGGGYFGGGGGQSFSYCCADGAGGGGSSYLSSTLISEGSFSASNSAGTSSFKIDRLSIIKQIEVQAKGVKTPNLTLTSQDSNFGGVVRCILTSPNVQETPVFSKPVSYEVTNTRNIVKFEAYTFDNKYDTSLVNLNESEQFTIDSDTFGSEYSIIQFHSTEKTIPLTMFMYGSKGVDNGSYRGGEGGVSTIRFDVERNVEYTLIGISNNSSVFLYRGSNLIAVVGEGGDAGDSGSGGDGGGINIPGGDGGGRLGGDGGTKVNTGTLSLQGSYGSIYENSGIDLNPGDEVATAPAGGRSISCTKGSYWIDLGIAACSDNSSSEIQFVNVDGTTISQSSNVIRGFKPGYTISNTSGKEINNGGRGGNGATGGVGGISGSGGGGGSGYSDGSVTVNSTTLGGSSGNSKIIIQLIS